MKMIVPITVTDGVLSYASIPENDYPAWSSGTTYFANERVILTSTHTIYQSVQSSNTAHNPATDDGTWWVPIGSTNRWRAFDRKTGQSASASNEIVYELTLPSICTGVAMVGLGAGEVRVQVISGPDTVYDESVELVDGLGIYSFFSYFTFAPEYSDRAAFEDLPGYTGYTLRVTISAPGGVASVGEIIVGRVLDLGQTITDTEISFEDTSIIERDEWGNVSITQRPSYDLVTFKFAIPAGGEERVRRAIRDQRAKPAFYYTDAEMLSRGLSVYGLAKPLRIPLNVGVSFATLETEELS